jgi:hypothetical protein
MKVRGLRNRAKLAARYTYRTVIPYARLDRRSYGGMHAITFNVIAEYADGCYRLEHESVTDGYGRPVGTPKVIAKPAEDPEGPDGWLRRYFVRQGMSREAYDLITGKGESVDAT